MNFKISCEIAKAHDGKLTHAYALIDDAIDAGADMVKFQAYNVSDLNNVHPNHNRYKEANLNLDQLKTIKNYCESKGFTFYTSCFSIDLLPYLSKMTDIIKIPSTFLMYEPFVNSAISLFREIHISTGMHDLATATKFLDKYADRADKQRKLFIPYHCVSLYPTPPDKARLCRIKYYKKRYGSCGYSDHTVGNQASLIAWHYGATVIEKHFALNNTNQPWCWTDKELKMFVNTLKYERDMVSDGTLTQDEVKNFLYYRGEFHGLEQWFTEQRTT